MKKVLLVLLMACAGSGVSLSQQLDSMTVRIKGMKCDECAHKVMVKVMENPGVNDIRFNIERRTATIIYDKQQTCEDSIKAPLNGTRYNPTPYSTSDVILRGFGQRMELDSEADARRAVASLQGKTGIDSLAPHVDKHYLFIRYDANKTCKADIRKELIGAGFTPSNYYTGKVIAYGYYAIPAAQATPETLEQVMALDGVEDVSVNAVRETMAVTYFTDETDAAKLLAGIKAAGIKAVNLKRSEEGGEGRENTPAVVF